MAAYSFCSTCGNALAPDDAFCGVCGSKAGVAAATPGPATPAPPAPTPAAASAETADYPTARRPLGDAQASPPTVPDTPVGPTVGSPPRAVPDADRFETAVVLEHAWQSTRQQYPRWLGVLAVAAALPLIISLISWWLINAATSDLGYGSPAGLGAVVALGGGYAMSAIDKFVLIIGLIGVLASTLAVFYAWLGLIRNAHAVAAGGRPEIARLLSPSRFGWFLVCAFVYLGIVVITSFPIPIIGLGVAMALGLFGFALVAQPQISGFAALGSSWDRVTRHFWGYIGLQVVLIGVPVAILGLGLVALQFGLVGILAGQDALMLLIALILLVAMLLAAAFALAFTVTGEAIAYRRLYRE